jgi:sorbitol-specific phosphotransferase system component IIC
MFSKVTLPSLRAVAKCAVIHAAVTATFWFGPLMYVALGLGFKEKEKWTFWDHVLSVVALPVAEVLTMPGRFLVWDGVGGIVIPTLLTSAIWGVALSFGFVCLARWRTKHNI